MNTSKRAQLIILSTVTLFWINLISTMSSTIAYSARVVIITKATTSRIYHKLVETSERQSLSTTLPLLIFSIPSTPFLSAVGSPMLTTTSCSTSSQSSKIWLALKLEMSVWFSMSLFEAKIQLHICNCAFLHANTHCSS